MSPTVVVQKGGVGDGVSHLLPTSPLLKTAHCSFKVNNSHQHYNKTKASLGSLLANQNPFTFKGLAHCMCRKTMLLVMSLDANKTTFSRPDLVHFSTHVHFNLSYNTVHDNYCTGKNAQTQTHTYTAPCRPTAGHSVSTIQAWKHSSLWQAHTQRERTRTHTVAFRRGS